LFHFLLNWKRFLKNGVLSSGRNFVRGRLGMEKLSQEENLADPNHHDEEGLAHAPTVDHI
jgi:hypothetical protein